MATNLATGWLGEPQSPFVLKRMLDVEVVFVMEDGDKPFVGFGGRIETSLTLWGDGNGCEVDLFRHCGGCTAELMLDGMGWDGMEWNLD